MGLLSSIAAALSEGVGNGMVANAKWGIAEDEQAKKEAAENSRLGKMLAKYDADRESRDKIYAGQLEESKNERLSREEQARLERENNLKIAGMRDHGGGGKNGLASPVKQLEMLDATIRGIDNERARLLGQMEGADPQTAKSLQVSIDALSSQRENLLNSGDANAIWSANGQIGAAHRSQFFASTKDEKAESSDNPPESLVFPPPRASTKTGSTLSGGLLAKMQELDAGKQAVVTPEAQPNNQDLSSYADRFRQWATPAEKPDWNGIKAPKGGWESPITTKEVQYKNGQKGYTIGWSD